ncbi:MAG: DUF2167 domain-containing protein [Variovorax paradoxus]|jgi:uncharacterized membrane-anchored protein|nr:MAG: DUF2167 domain-containing protein [Variovorax paradoxus]PZQ04361.1 MAG: DUF2167 domain-containing protein [Variovorax paradoxus]
MRYILPRFVAAFLLACTLGTQAADSDKPSPQQAELAAAYKAAQDTHQAGPAAIALRNQAHLQLPAGYLWIPQPAAGQLMQAMGNRTDDSLIGTIYPAGEGEWFVVVKFVNEGYIKDDDAKDWNADELLTSLREGTEAANEERAKRGIAAIEVVGWAQKPQYDQAAHRLAWSALTRDKGDTGGEQGVNYNTYALGREGYISLNMVTAANALEKHKPEAMTLLGALQYDEGKRYADFNSSTDKVAAYGLTALVAGAAAKKLGLLAVIAAFLAKFAKVAVVAGGAAIWGFAKLFGKKKPEAPKA